MRTKAQDAVVDRMPTEFRLVASYLERTIGLDPQTVGAAAIARAIRRRMEISGDTDERAYLARLDRDREEHARFVDEVVVPESWFFRDGQVFEGLREVALRWAADWNETLLRVLCVPCASGEEPYSVAMTFLEAGLSQGRFRIDAADVSPAALARATAGRYSANAFRGADLTFRDRWFRESGPAAELLETVREQVHFFEGNLLDDSFAADREPYHVVLCRNLLIYLTTDARRRVERTIDRLLLPEGLLVLGAVEPPMFTSGWVPAAGKTAFTLRRAATAAPFLAPPAPRVRTSDPHRAPLHPGPQTSPPVTCSSGEAASAGGHDSGNTSRHGTAFLPPSVDELLAEARALADANRHADAMAACQRHQEAAGPSAGVFFLMATLHQTTGDLERAEACLHKTLYMDPDREDAFLALARIVEQRGDAILAERYRRSAARVLARKGTA